ALGCGRKDHAVRPREHPSLVPVGVADQVGGPPSAPCTSMTSPTCAGSLPSVPCFGIRSPILARMLPPAPSDCVDLGGQGFLVDDSRGKPSPTRRAPC